MLAVMSARVSRLRPGIDVVAGAAVMLGVAAKGMQGRLTDPDVWWHLRTGALIVSERSIPSGDPYSFTRPGARWIVHEWGSEVFLHAIRAIGGLQGIIIWRAVMLVAIYSLVAALIVRDAGRSVWTWCLIALTAFAGVQSWTERPSLFSFLFFAVVLWLVRARSRAIWALVPLAALWVNLHGMVLVGLGVVALLAVVEWLKVALRWEGVDRAWAARLSLVLVASTVAAFANPYGPRALGSALSLVSTVSPVVTEWASPDFHEAAMLLFLALILVTVAALALTPRPPDPSDVALAVAFIALGLTATRNVPLSAIALGTVAARSLPGALRAAVARRLGERARAQRTGGPIEVVALVLVVAVFGTLIGYQTESDVVPKEFPVALVRALPDGARLLTRDTWAGYALHERWPVVRVFFDTRVDFYGEGFATTYNRTLGGRGAWEHAIDEHCVTAIIAGVNDGIAERLLGRRGWRIEAEERLLGGERALLYVRRSACVPA